MRRKNITVCITMLYFCLWNVVSPLQAADAVEEGNKYLLRNVRTREYLYDNGGQATTLLGYFPGCVWTFENASAQSVAGAYYMKNVGSGMYLTVTAGAVAGDIVKTSDTEKYPFQMVAIRKNYKITPWNITGINTVNGADAKHLMWADINTSEGQWVLEDVTETIDSLIAVTLSTRLVECADKVGCYTAEQLADLSTLVGNNAAWQEKAAAIEALEKEEKITLAAGKFYTITNVQKTNARIYPVFYDGQTLLCDAAASTTGGEYQWGLLEQEGKSYLYNVSAKRFLSEIEVCGAGCYVGRGSSVPVSFLVADNLPYRQTFTIAIADTCFVGYADGHVTTSATADTDAEKWILTYAGDADSDFLSGLTLESGDYNPINSLEMDNDEYYYISFKKGGYMLQGSVIAGKVATAAAANSGLQQWRIVEQKSSTPYYYIINKSGGKILYYDTEKELFCTGNPVSVPRDFARLAIQKSSSTGFYEIGVLNYQTEKTMNMKNGAGAGREIMLYNKGDGGNPVKFYLPVQMNFPLNEATIKALSHDTPPTEKLTLWYDTPSTIWMDQSLPIGNGQFGAMLFGGVRQDEIQFNDKTLWTGTSGLPIGAGSGYGSYRNFGNLYIKSPMIKEDAVITNYRRELDIAHAIGRTVYAFDGVNYKREYIADHPDDVVAIHLTADKAEKISVILSIADANANDYAANATGVTYTEEGAAFGGKLDLVSYYCRFGIKAYGDKARLTAETNGLYVTEADSLTIYLRGNTNYDCNSATYIYDADQLPERVDAAVDRAMQYTFAELKERHMQDYRTLFGRCSFTITPETANVKSTPALISDYNRNAQSYLDNRFLEELYFNYGRYLMIACARGIDLPSNLQGIWCNVNNPAWNSDIHSNINVEMNYWPAEVTNLSELHNTFLNYIYNEALVHTQWQENVYKYLTTNGTTKQKAGGFFFTTENNIFGRCSQWTGQNYAVANAWYCMHMYQHYEFTLDEKYLKEKALPVMLSCVAFWKNRLVKDNKDGKWICPREYSPEQGPTNCTTPHAQQLVWSLFDNVLKAYKVLGEESGITADELIAIQSYFDNLDNGLYTEVVTKANGEVLLKEWKDYSQNNTGELTHRHLSHLIGLYPGTQISETSDKEIYDAALRSLKWRGMQATGWAMGWKINLWARACDGTAARTLLHNALRKSTFYNETSANQGDPGIYNNLFDSHAPFQIDGNFGACAGIAEMLLQSHAGYLYLLPALPDDWKEGEFTGLKAQGNFTVSATWKDGVMNRLVITSVKGQPLSIRYPGIGTWLDENTGQTVTGTVDDDVLSFETAVGATYVLVPNPNAMQTVLADKAGGYGNEIYDLQGRRIEQPIKGVYIQGNKKIAK